MYGNYSDQYNRFTLAYLLVMGAVLDWLCLDQNTYCCQIEQYHIYMWRNRWGLNGWLNIFMDSEINQAMLHPEGPGSRQYFVNDPYFHAYFHVGICTDIFLSKIGSL